MLVERVLVWTGARVGGYSGEPMLGWAGAWVDWVACLALVMFPSDSDVEFSTDVESDDSG